MIFWITVILLIVILALILYWQLIITEGTYLGAPLVALLYDWTAERYNSIKEFDDEVETHFLALPLLNRLYRQPDALVLDVATGTGRVPLALLKQSDFAGKIVGLDRAAKMLQVAIRDTEDDRSRAYFIRADAMALPFASNSFTMVTCLEALEFFPKPEKGLGELIRVLASPTPQKPRQGWLVTTRRTGWEAKLMPGKTWSEEQMEQLLQQYRLRYIDIQAWEDIYNLVWAQKTGEIGD